MQILSVVIVCKNEAKEIGNFLISFKGLTDDIIIYDTGSTDGTQKIVNDLGIMIYEGDWEGFGKTKNKAITLAKYDWILSLDADEAIDEELKNNLVQLDLSDERKIYEFRYKTFWGNKWLKYGVWKTDSHIRLFNRNKIFWNNALVHESLVIPDKVETIIVKGFVLHKTTANAKDYEHKMKNYSTKVAEYNFSKGKKTNSIKMFLFPSFSFLKNYFFRLGFLDGREGFDCARIFASYTYWKYKKLNELNKKK